MDDWGINWSYLARQGVSCIVLLLFGAALGILAALVIQRANRSRQVQPSAARQAPGEREVGQAIRLNKPVKILVGAGTAWVVLYPLLFIVLWLTMFLSFFQPDMGGGSSPFSETLFFAIFPVHLLTILLQIALVGFYLIHILKNALASETARIVLGVGVFFFAFIAMPTYYYLYIWREHPPAWALAYHQADS